MRLLVCEQKRLRLVQPVDHDLPQLSSCGVFKRVDKVQLGVGAAPCAMENGSEGKIGRRG
jgi:hypothetical protein